MLSSSLPSTLGNYVLKVGDTMSGNLNMGTNKLIGGTGITDILKLQGTTGNGTTTNPAIQLLTGNNGGTTALTVLNNGSVGVGTTSPGAKLQIDTGSTSTVGQIIKGAASQTADLQQWQNSAGTVSSSVSSAGVISAPSFNSTGGKSIFFGSSSTQAPIRIVPWGTATNTVDGEVWATSGSGLFYNQNGYTINLAGKDYLGSYAGSPSIFSLITTSGSATSTNLLTANQSSAETDLTGVSQYQGTLS